MTACICTTPASCDLCCAWTFDDTSSFRGYWESCRNVGLLLLLDLYLVPDIENKLWHALNYSKLTEGHKRPKYVESAKMLAAQGILIYDVCPPLALQVVFW